MLINLIFLLLLAPYCDLFFNGAIDADHEQPYFMTRSDPLFVHIPKTAGMSFRFTINSYGGFQVQHTEKCYVELRDEYLKHYPHDTPFVISFFRSPKYKQNILNNQRTILITY